MANSPLPTPSPKILATPLQALSSKNKQDLLNILALLDALHVRNKNQHRRNHWFKSLQAFRKQLALLLSEIESTKKTAAGKRIEDRLRFWDDKCIHQWYLHFSQLVAMGPFAALGLVLMASVARVSRITGITAFYEESASDDMREMMKAIDDGMLADKFGGMLDEEAIWDEGEVVVREE